jgi:multidrug resistance efflux pump
MRKSFYGLGVITALVLVAGTIGIFVLSRNGAALDTASRAYVDDSVVKIVANWNAQEL